jgi:hypothetical protein
MGRRETNGKRQREAGDSGRERHTARRREFREAEGHVEIPLLEVGGKKLRRAAFAA